MTELHHGPQSVEQVVKQLAKRALDAKAISLVCSFGEPGSGKSIGNLLLGNMVQSLLGTGPLTPQGLLEQLRFKPRDFPRMAQSLPNRRVAFCDEGSGEGANKMRQMGIANVELAIDLDACRGREQPIFWANPYRNDLTPQVKKHMTWALVWHPDHTATFWEADPLHPLFGTEPFLRERFTCEDIPWFGDVLPEVEESYQRIKRDHMAGLDPFTDQKERLMQQEWIPLVRRLLDEDAKSLRDPSPFPAPR